MFPENEEQNQMLCRVDNDLARGRGSKVETLPGGDSLGEIGDLTYFTKKMARGLRIPTSYLQTRYKYRQWLVTALGLVTPVAYGCYLLFQ